MTRTELAELIRNGENSGAEFKRDDVHADSLAKEMAALLNLKGGHILLGVENDGTVSGLTRDPHDAEEWVMNVARENVRQPFIPFWQTFQWDDERTVGVVTLPADAPDKPYKAKRGKAWVTQIRIGSTSRDATDDEEARLYMQSGRIQYDRRAVPGATLDDLDIRRLVNYFRDIRRQAHPDVGDEEGWERLLTNTEIMDESSGRSVPTVAGLLLFGSRPKKHLPHAGISATAYPGTEKDYNARERSTLSGPLVSLVGQSMDDVQEAGVIEQALTFVKNNIAVEASVDDGGRRTERWEYPREAVREAVVNAVAHRDYTISVIDIELSIYSDRIEIISPGRLPNTVTVEKMRAGYRASRNELIKEILRDYRYIEATGLGVPRKIIEGMRAHNNTEPDLIEDEDRFIVRLWK